MRREFEELATRERRGKDGSIWNRRNEIWTALDKEERIEPPVRNEFEEPATRE